jgi:hypothetical protein
MTKTIMTDAERAACRRKITGKAGQCACDGCTADQARRVAEFWATWDEDQTKIIS